MRSEDVGKDMASVQTLLTKHVRLEMMPVGRELPRASSLHVHSMLTYTGDV